MRRWFAGQVFPAGVLLLLPLTASPAIAQPAAPGTALQDVPATESASARPPRPLSLDEALALGEKNNRDLQAARARLRGSHADVERALTALLPTVSAQGKFTYNYP